MFTKKPAFTLFEMLITLTIFSLVSGISVTLVVNGLRAAKKIQAQVLLYSESQALMDQMARDVERSTVDYEAYYARDVKGDSGWETPDYGQYAQSFYDPGTGGTESGPYTIGDLYKATCSDGGTYPDDCSNPIFDEQDEDTGAHPFTGLDTYSGYGSTSSSDMNAFCEDATDETCGALVNGVKDELILVNSSGDARTVYAFDSGNLSKMELTGTDSDNDGVVDLWTCGKHYSCTGTGTESNSIPAYISEFINLTPDALKITQFQILIAPFEDPYRAFAESDVQVQPQITIVMKVSLSDSYSQGLLGVVPSILIQRTISTGVYSKVPSY